ncbi:MAG: hypothetical protein C5B60_11425 [Chloroflexi bacterium]|nr:MAG: hypothetical protein C5B60_11425 [Chloroflexota bacterium]
MSLGALAVSEITRLGTLNSVGTTLEVDTFVAPVSHTVQVVVTGSPTACTLHLEGSLDDLAVWPRAWADLSGDVSITGSPTIFHVINRPVRYIRVNLTTLTGGTNPAVTIKYLGVQ